MWLLQYFFALQDWNGVERLTGRVHVPSPHCDLKAHHNSKLASGNSELPCLQIDSGRLSPLLTCFTFMTDNCERHIQASVSHSFDSRIYRFHLKMQIEWSEEAKSPPSISQFLGVLRFIILSQGKITAVKTGYRGKSRINSGSNAKGTPREELEGGETFFSVAHLSVFQSWKFTIGNVTNGEKRHCDCKSP